MLVVAPALPPPTHCRLMGYPTLEVSSNVLSTSNIAMLTGNIGRPGTGVNPLRARPDRARSMRHGSAACRIISGYQSVAVDAARQKMEEESGESKVCQLQAGSMTVTEMLGAAGDEMDV